MLYPSINLLRTKADSKFTLVSMAAKRARDLIDGKPALVDIKIDKPVSIATEEIAEDLITYTRNFSSEDEAIEYEEELEVMENGYDEEASDAEAPAEE
jgi:DNA-directed RNA polymerase subunit omega